MVSYTQPTGFLAATFPSGTIANTTNITAGTMTTTTNLTNAPISGDFTATMKTSLNAATPAVASVTGDVSGKVLGGGAGTITGTGVRAVDGSGNAVAPASATTDIQSRLPAALTANGNMKASVLEWISTLFSEGAVGRMAAAVQQFFNIASPTSTMNQLTGVTTTTNVTNAPTVGDFTATMKTSLNAATPVPF